MAESALSNQRQFAERLRVQDLLRYFLPLHHSKTAGTAKPRVSTDPSLTAFAQLCALRLDCQRSFISLIDDKQQYILAEATRTTSFGSGDHATEDDALSFGQATLDLFSGVCPSTVACFTSPDDSLNVQSEYVKATRSYYVMSDMSKLEHYSTRPYVSGWPYMRYYAEVPLLSPSGFVIGSLCVVDNRPRADLDIGGLKVLEEVAGTVMDHLELCTIKAQRNQAEHMIQALGQFSEGNNSIRGWWMRTQSERKSEPAFRHLSITERADVQLGTKNGNTLSRPSNLLAYTSSGSSLKTIDSEQELEITESDPEYRLHERPKPARKPSTTGSATSTAASTSTIEIKPTIHEPSSPGDPSELSLLSKQRNMLSRAANLMREGTRSSGVVLLDPRSTHGQLITRRRPSDGDGCPPNGGPTNLLEQIRTSSPDTMPKPFAGVLSCSTYSGNGTDTVQVPEDTLATFLRCFPDGGIITFDGKGVVSAKNPSSVWNLESNGVATDARLKLNEFEVQDIQELGATFPGVTSLIAYPLWDLSREKWFAYAFAWTTDATRVFERQDFTYLKSFVNSILVESSRIETLAANQAKNTFVSSISHELRSPLHGIMATMEILRGMTSEPIYEEEFATLEACGSTLLDTIDNVLSFSKLNNATASTHGPPQVAVDMALLVEEIVTMSLSGNYFRRTQELINGGNSSNPAHDAGVTVICNVTSAHEWLFETDRASWKRVLLNLVGNSLKYTSSGFIVVKLDQEDHSDGLSRDIILSVEDSGQGMSEDYLANHLFKPFSQENSLASGTGLGLSIVSQLVNSLGGEINVVSEKGVGTKITVVAKCHPAKSSGLTSLPTNQIDLKLGLVGFDMNYELDDPAKASVPAHARRNMEVHLAISNAASRHGLQVAATDLEDCNSDILVMSATTYDKLDDTVLCKIRKPIILLCSRRSSTKTLAIPELVVSFFEPFGPEKFLHVINACLLLRESASITQHIPDSTVGGEPDLPLPLIPTSQPHRSSKPEPTIAPGASPAPTNPKILLVEDNPINLKLLTTCIKQMKQPHITAVDGSLAVQAYQKNEDSIELVFMDIQMPVMDGLDASRKIRELEKSSGAMPCYIVALTALGSLEAKQAAMDSGVDFFLTKPVSLKTLKELAVRHCSPTEHPG